MKKVLAVILLVTSSQVFAAHQTKSFLIQFATDEHSLDPAALKKLDEVTAFLKAHPTARIKLTGRTDFDGTIDYNLTLSRNRTTTVAEFLKTKGWHNTEIDEKWLGELKPLATNADALGKALNRSVEILITIISYDNAADWLKEQQQDNKEVFHLNRTGENSITTENETIINIPTNAFTTMAGKPVDNKNVKVLINEVNTAMDAVIHQVFTMSGDQLLETGGMMNIEAFSNNEKLQLAEGKEIKIQIPLTKATDDMFVFQGVADANGTIDWINTGNGFANTASKDMVSMKLNEFVLQRLISRIELRKPSATKYNLSYNLPKTVNIPSKPRMPATPEKPDARKLFSKLGWAFSTPQIRDKKVEKVYQNQMAIYNKRMATYDKRLEKYEAAAANHKVEIEKFESDKQLFYNWMRDTRQSVNNQINSIHEYNDKKRVAQGLHNLYKQSQSGTQYSQTPFKTLKIHVTKPRLTELEYATLSYLANLNRALSVLQQTPYQTILKKYTRSGKLKMSRLLNANKPWESRNFGMKSPNYYLDTFIISNQSDFIKIFGKEIMEEELKMAETQIQLRRENEAQQYFTGNSKNMGWINCDRYVSSELVKVSFTTLAGACQVVILQDINSILSPSYNNKSKELTTASVPKNARFKLLTLKIEGEQGFISVDEATAKSGLKISPEFRKVSLEEINGILAKL